MYPRNRRGDEYYPRNNKFIVNARKEIYARNRKGTQIYPNRNNFFARDASGNFYYAKDYEGNEYYPTLKNRSVFITDPELKIANRADGSQRYPSDSKGNEYYLKVNERPVLFLNSNGERYLAKNQKGCAMVPWNHFPEFIDEEPFVYIRDSDGTLVYIRESMFPLAPVIRCLCYLNIICPNKCRVY